jgi:hypothetical protein
MGGSAVPITIDSLCNIEEIKQLKSRYFLFLDTKQWVKWRAIFTDDASFEGTVKPYRDADEFVAATSKWLESAKTIHQGHMPEIRLLESARARGTWAMYDWVEFPAPDAAGQRGFVGYGHYQEEYRKEGDVWKIARLRLTRIRLDPLFGRAPGYDLPPGRLLSEANDWLDGG